LRGCNQSNPSSVGANIQPPQKLKKKNYRKLTDTPKLSVLNSCMV
jgi:hypothetical protein